VRVPVEERLGVYAGQDDCVRHDLPVDLGPYAGLDGPSAVS
jgi:hypothetical protein